MLKGFPSMQLCISKLQHCHAIWNLWTGSVLYTIQHQWSMIWYSLQWTILAAIYVWGSGFDLASVSSVTQSTYYCHSLDMQSSLLLSEEAWTCPPLEPIVLVFWSHRVVVSSVFSCSWCSPWLRFGKLIYRMKSDQMCLLCRFWRWKAHGCSWWVASVAVLYIRLLYVLILTWTCWSPSDNLLSPSLPLLTEDLNWLTMQI